MKLLLADDERELSRAIEVILRHNGYDVECAYDGEQAIEMAHDGDFDAYILDIMMPGKSGLEVLKYLRDNAIDAPVIMLTAKADISDRIAGLDSGANDYIVKPFAMGELLARIRAATREICEPTVLRAGNISLNKETLEMSNDKSSFRLGNLEYEMLRFLIKAEGKENSIEKIAERAWDCEAKADEVILYISYLRKKLDALNANIKIEKTSPNGYTLKRIDV